VHDHELKLKVISKHSKVCTNHLFDRKQTNIYNALTSNHNLSIVVPLKMYVKSHNIPLELMNQPIQVAGNC